MGVTTVPVKMADLPHLLHEPLIRRIEIQRS